MPDESIHHLVDTLKSNKNLAAVSPKIKFAWSPFAIQFAGYEVLQAHDGLHAKDRVHLPASQDLAEDIRHSLEHPPLHPFGPGRLGRECVQVIGRGLAEPEGDQGCQLLSAVCRQIGPGGFDYFPSSPKPTRPRISLPNVLPRPS